MVKEELIQRSPLRIFEQSIHGGLGKGKLGVLTGKKGVGKTACLVHIAIDKLFQEQHVIHVSFSQNARRVVSWYEDLFEEITNKRGLEEAKRVHDEVIRNRVIMNFSQGKVSVEQIVTSLRALIQDGGFKADVIMFDGYRLSSSQIEDIEFIRSFAADMNLEVWFSISAEEEVSYDEYGVAKPIETLYDHVDVLIALAYKQHHVALTLIKDREVKLHKPMGLKLDPKTLLIINEADPEDA